MGLFSFKAFFSHRYESPGTNLYFFNLFNELAEVQFEVDKAVSDDGKKLPTNVTRLERMVRDADAFIGIYPFPGSSEDPRNLENLVKESRYFRLEMDLAIRSGKPAIIFYDKQFADLLKPPSPFYSVSFDSLEISGNGGTPKKGMHKKVFQQFCKAVKAKKALDDLSIVPERTTVGLVIPEINSPGSAYDEGYTKLIYSVMAGKTYRDLRVFDWPPKLQRNTFSLLEKLDMVIVNIDEETAASGVIAYMHGRFIPMIRIARAASELDAAKIKLLGDFLYGGVEVGYSKDTIIWSDAGSLQAGLEERLDRINSPIKRIKTFDDAIEYFNSAAPRKESVFLSYTSKDKDFGSEFSKSLKQHFHQVFDYMDGKSIRPGQPWIDEIFTQLQSSEIGISLLSPAYLQSENCMHELEDMIAQRDSKKMYWLPIRLTDKLDSPSFIKNIEHLFASNYKSVGAISRELIRLFSLTKSTDTTMTNK